MAKPKDNQQIPLIFILLFSCLLGACAPATPKWAPVVETSDDLMIESTIVGEPRQEEESSIEKYLVEPEIAPGYLIKVSSPDDKNLNTEARVAFDGTLKLPYNLKLNTTSMSVKQLRENMTAAYKPYFKSAPTLDVRVKEKSHMVEVQGLVEKPGRYLVRTDSSLDEVIATAGNLKTGANDTVLANYARVESGPSDKATFINLSDHFSGARRVERRWIGGTKLVFQKDSSGGAGFNKSSADGNVRVLGQVKAPGDYGFRENSGFFDYFIEAGGPTDRADLANLVLVRGDGAERRAMRFSVEQLESVPALQPGDVLMVHADNPSSTEKKSRVWGVVGSFLNTIATTVLAVAAI